MCKSFDVIDPDFQETFGDGGGGEREVFVFFDRTTLIFLFLPVEELMGIFKIYILEKISEKG